MSYYDKIQVEDAVIVDNKATTNEPKADVPKDLAEKLAQVSNKTFAGNLLEKSSITTKTSIVVSVLSMGFAVWKGKSVLKFGIAGAVGGLVLGNLFGSQIKRISNIKTNKDVKTK